MTQIWSATVTRIGDDAPEMFDAGCFILFGEPVPDALADVSLVHDGAGQPADVRAGDTFWLGEDGFAVEEVGERANANLAELGHVVVYVNQSDQKLLPGAVKATGDGVPMPLPGQTVRFTRGE